MSKRKPEETLKVTDGKKHETLSTFCMLEFKGRNFQQEINFSSEKGSDRFIFPFSSSAAL